MAKLREFKTAGERRETLEKILKVSLKGIGNFSFSEEGIRNKNIENLIGVAQIPLGVAGPLRICSGQATRNYFIPLATTEGALIASVNRGCKAVGDAGGASVLVEKIGITRGPVFKTKSLRDSLRLKEWLLSHQGDLSDLCKETSAHLKLLKIEPQILGQNLYVRFYFDTDQAMGMNMATIATNLMVRLIEAKTKARCLSLSGNFCVDKKPSWLNFILGRGRKAWAEVEISQKVLKQVLKTEAQKIYEVWLNKCYLGSTLSGSLGANGHFANIVAAIFCATGQDLAHVTEGSLGLTTAEVRGKNLYFSVYLPDLVVGTVGGGMGLITQKEALSIIFGEEKPDADELAKVVAGAVLAGELSLLASLAEGSLARAHENLGRGKC